MVVLGGGGEAGRSNSIWDELSATKTAQSTLNQNDR